MSNGRESSGGGTPKQSPSTVGKGVTKKGGKGEPVLRLQSGEAKLYLCQHICAAAKAPMISKSGAKLKQAAMTLAIRIEAASADEIWGYKAEVGYRMRDTPPSPIMSQNFPHAPSSIPFVRALIEQMFVRQPLETTSVGRLRIPDCIVLKIKDAELDAMRKSKNPDWSKLIPVQKNIDKVVEIKFGNDELGYLQAQAYRKIPRKSNDFRLLQDTDCNCDTRQNKRYSEVKAYAPLPQSAFLKPIRQQNRNIGLPFGLGRIVSQKTNPNDPVDVNQFLDATPIVMIGGCAVVIGAIVFVEAGVATAVAEGGGGAVTAASAAATEMGAAVGSTARFVAYRFATVIP